MYVLDSSALIELLSDSKIGRKIAGKIGDSPAITTAFTVNELLIGVRGNHRKAIQKLFDGITVLNYDFESAIKSVFIEESLASKGKMINKLDILIASICLRNKMTIITLDKHFKRIPGLKIVSL